MAYPYLVLCKKVTKTEQAKLPDSDFCIVENTNGKKVRRYPVPDVENALDALTRTIVPGNDADQAAVKKFVFKRYPFLRKSFSSKAAFGNAPHNIQVLANTFTVLAETNDLSFKPRKQRVEVVANDKVKFTIPHKALFLSANKFKPLVAKLTKEIAKNKA